VVNATVFDDANGNMKLDPGESYGITDANGNFSYEVQGPNFEASIFEGFLPSSKGERIVG